VNSTSLLSPLQHDDTGEGLLQPVEHFSTGRKIKASCSWIKGGKNTWKQANFLEK